MFINGAFFAPTMILVVSLVETMVPASRLTEGFAWLGSGIGIGVAAGATLSGIVVDAWGSRAGFAVALAAGAIALLSMVLVRWGMQARSPSDSPSRA